jgi:hypothetical protein
VFAEAAREVTERHTEWDSPHCFEILVWDGAKLFCRSYACIMPDWDPADYPALMIRLAREDFEKHPGAPAYAYLLQVEGVSATGDEAAFAWCMDIHGRAWCAKKTRSEPGRISESFFAPGTAPSRAPMNATLLAVAQAAGVLGHGLAVTLPGGGSN